VRSFCTTHFHVIVAVGGDGNIDSEVLKSS
jgi:hypothetical protein